ncbi:gliding motility lipoprotein GldH [Flavobacterium lacus]|uniref:Protein involved in gliding motility GldH n=1 Tax=Flavobacterium lacus TaxID=1353778 RepID=A0A328WTU0_9FLAO|nr:gliding motility lipoprotein GldH [Flavobacterium lacus]RAR49790.1 protein involved in gliding motility GldH [Flavobacterium lacus]
MTLRNSLFLVFLLIIVTSCDKKRLFDDYKKVGKVWHKDSIVTFLVEQKDTVAKHNVYINIRNNKNYPFNNLFLIVEMEQPNSKTMVDTLEYKMAEPDGSLMGKGLTDTKDNKLFYKENFVFPKAGSYKIYIQQAVRKSGKIEGIEVLEGVTDVGLRIEKAE